MDTHGRFLLDSHSAQNTRSYQRCSESDKMRLHQSLSTFESSPPGPTSPPRCHSATLTSEPEISGGSHQGPPHITQKFSLWDPRSLFPGSGVLFLKYFPDQAPGLGTSVTWSKLSPSLPTRGFLYHLSDFPRQEDEVIGPYCMLLACHRESTLAGSFSSPLSEI